MYKCLNENCETLFEEADTTVITHWEVDTKRERIVPMCPRCGCIELDELKPCPSCATNYLTDTRDHCDCCYEDVSKAISRLAIEKDITWSETVKLVTDWVDRRQYDVEE